MVGQIVRHATVIQNDQGFVEVHTMNRETASVQVMRCGLAQRFIARKMTVPKEIFKYLLTKRVVQQSSVDIANFVRGHLCPEKSHD